MIKHWIDYRDSKLLSNHAPYKKVNTIEWGLNYLDNSAHSSNTKSFLESFAKEKIAKSEEFFTPLKINEYFLDGDILRFQSAVKTRDERNNTVWCRFFPDNSPNKRAVIVVPHWNAVGKKYDKLCKLLNLFGITALRISLPYHDERNMEGAKISEGMLSSNIGRTIQSCRQAVLDIRRAADWLEKEGYSKLGLVGFSIGTSIMSLTVSHDRRFKVNVFVLASSDFGEVVWTGQSTEHIRKGLESHISLEELKVYWSLISPITFVDRLKGMEEKHLFITAKYDYTMLPYLTERLFSEYQKHGVNFEHVVLPCSHYTIQDFPFKYIIGFLITRYLQKEFEKRLQFNENP